MLVLIMFLFLGEAHKSVWEPVALQMQLGCNFHHPSLMVRNDGSVAQHPLEDHGFLNASLSQKI